jgi:CheY-like chemotaxis protein
MKSILVIDDSEVIRDEIVTLLAKNKSYAITTACDGEEGYQALRDEKAHYDLVILDYHMPGMTGIDILRKLKSENVVMKSPVILLTSEIEVRGSEIKDLNIIAWAIKPIEHSRFEALVEKIFNYFTE